MPAPRFCHTTRNLVLPGILGLLSTCGWGLFNSPNSPTSPSANTLSGPSSITGAYWLTSTDSSPAYSWTAVSSTDTAIVDHYEYSIGTSEGTSELLDWTTTTLVSAAAISGLPLSSGNTYYFNVRTADAHGNHSEPTSTSWKVVSSGSDAFGAAVNYTVPSGPRDVQFYDLNEDGKLDMIVSEGSPSANLSIFLGNGDGTFASPTTINSGPNPQEFAVADFNNDGHLDIALSNYGPTPGVLSIYLANGDGSLQSPNNIIIGTSITSTAMGDLDSDGYVDLVTTSDIDTKGYVLINGHAGDFTNNHFFTPSENPKKVIIADVNNDGKLDMITANEGSFTGPYANGKTVLVLLGDGAGFFTSQNNFTVGTMPRGLAAADINHDGNLDLVTANFAASNISVLIGIGNGFFNAHVDYSVGTDPHGLCLADVNGDGQPDVIVANSGSNNLGILLGNSDGTFQSMITLPVGTTPFRFGVADLNGDGKLDIGVGNRGTDTVSVFLGL